MSCSTERSSARDAGHRRGLRDLGVRSVLIVDDDPVVVRALRRWLRLPNDDVSVAMDAMSAIDRCSERGFDRGE